MEVLNKLTQRAKRVVVALRGSGEEAIPSTSILNALLEEKQGVAAEALRDWGSEFDSQKVIALGDLLEVAYDEARRLKSFYVGTEHLFLSLVRLADPENLKGARKRVQQLASLPRNFFPPREPSSSPLLDAFGTDLTDLARRGELDPVIGREALLERVIRVLLRKEKNSPILVGEAGVGKTALARGLAERVAVSDVPLPLIGAKVIHLDFSAFASSFSPRGDLEAGFSSLLEEIRRQGNVVLFIDEFHTLMGGGGVIGVASGPINILKEALGSGSLRLLGATNVHEYQKHLEFDQGLTRRLQPVQVPEPTEAESLEITRALAPTFEEFHHVHYSSKALIDAVKLSKRYITESYLPDKALDVLDEAGAWVRFQQEKSSPEFRDVVQGLDDSKKKFEAALESHNLDEALHIRTKQNVFKRRIESISPREGRERVRVGRDVVATIVAHRTGIPVSKLEKGEEQRFRDLEKYLSAKVVGQDYAVRVLAKALRRSRVGLTDPERPIGSFLFIGPTGTGKTELARVLAEFLFGKREDLIRVDMSEFRERHTTSRLIGAPPGYVGYGQGGELTERIRRNPYSVIVFDEIEKAHPEVLNLLLQVMEEGALTDGQGKLASFRNAVIILTSNVGADLIRRGELGFSTGDRPDERAYVSMQEKLIANLKETVRPEFLNRLSAVVVFRALSRKDILKIVDLRIQELAQKIAAKEMSIKVTQEARKLLADKGYSEEYGARPLERVIEDEIEAPLSERIIAGEVNSGDTISVRVVNGKIVVDRS